MKRYPPRLVQRPQGALEYRGRGDVARPASPLGMQGIAIGVAVGGVLTLPALVAAVMSMGVGHGDYDWARGLFPVPMCVAMFFGGIGPAAIGLAFLQFPAYGALVGYGEARGRKALLVVIGAILLAHMLGYAVCSGSSGFS